jgi:hypothetical protein
MHLLDGQKGIKERHYVELDKGQIEFGIRDQKGRAIGYRWNIQAVAVELMSDAELAASKGCYIHRDGEPLHYVELRTSTTRDGISYGPSTPRVKRDTLEEARRIAVSRTEAARKANAKKFAAFNAMEEA